MDAAFFPADIREWQGAPVQRKSVFDDGYRGIWYALGWKFEYGDKYSGGLGTYTANHQPMAVYSERGQKTFFTYGGAPAADKRELAIMVGVFDHATGRAGRPAILYFDAGVDDPHDNAAIQVDRDGHVWVFKSGRGNARPGLIFRSLRPFAIDEFELLDVREFSYPQIWTRSGGDFLLLFTKYDYAGDRSRPPARELFFQTSPDGRAWSAARRLAGFGGHYQTSGTRGDKTVTFFNWHPDSDVDRRTNLYFAQTVDAGKTWTTADGTPLDLPLAEPSNAALVIDYQARGKCMYTCDVNFDRFGHPVLLYLTSAKGEPGPGGGQREWTLLHWTGARWEERVVTASEHNYDMGSLFIDGPTWRIMGPTEGGPQRWGAGGEIALWTSTDDGRTWALERRVTGGSEFNHSYVRRPDQARDPFAAFWADGHADQPSPSRLYFSDHLGREVRMLPYEMNEADETPVRAAPE